MTQPTSDVLTAAECAALLGVSRGTLYNWRMANYGPKALRDSTPLKYLRAEVEAWKRARPCTKCGLARVRRTHE